MARNLIYIFFMFLFFSVVSYAQTWDELYYDSEVLLDSRNQKLLQLSEHRRQKLIKKVKTKAQAERFNGSQVVSAEAELFNFDHSNAIKSNSKGNLPTRNKSFSDTVAEHKKKRTSLEYIY